MQFGTNQYCRCNIYEYPADCLVNPSLHKACTGGKGGERRRQSCAPSFVAMTQPNGGTKKYRPSNLNRPTTLSTCNLHPSPLLPLRNDPLPQIIAIQFQTVKREFESSLDRGLRQWRVLRAHTGARARAHNQKACRNRELAPSRGCAAIPWFSINRQQQRWRWWWWWRRRQRRPAMLTQGEPQRRGDGGSQLLV